MAAKKAPGLPTILDQAKLCPNDAMPSSASEDDIFQFGHDFIKRKSQERLRSILAAFLLACEYAPAWYYRVISASAEVTTKLQEPPLPNLSSVFGLDNEESNDLLLQCDLLRRNKNGKVEFRRNEWESFRDMYSLDIEFDLTKSNNFMNGNKKIWVMRIGSYATTQQPFDSKVQAKKIVRGEFFG